MQQHSLRRIAAAILALPFLALATPAPAQTTQPAQPSTQQVPLVIAVIDVQQVLKDSTAAKAVRAQIDKQREVYQAQLAQQENTLREADKKLAEERPTLAADVFAQRRDQLGKQIDQLRQTSDKLKQQLEQAFNAGMGQVTQALAGVLADIAKQRGLTLVLNKAMVPLSANNFDITDDTLKMLNAKLPTVTVPKPAGQ